MQLSKEGRLGHGPAFCIITWMECRPFNMITKKDDRLYDCKYLWLSELKYLVWQQ